MSTLPPPAAPKWYEVHENLAGLAGWLAERDPQDAAQVAAFIEKPWKYEDEWNEYQTDLHNEYVRDQARIRGERV
jgi:hypothetical protein